MQTYVFFQEPDASGLVIVYSNGKDLQNGIIALESNGGGEAKIISTQAYTDDNMNELCQSQESNADVVDKNVWIQYNVDSSIRTMYVKAINVKTILSNPSAQVGSHIWKDGSHCHMLNEPILNPLFPGNPITCTLTNS